MRLSCNRFFIDATLVPGGHQCSLCSRRVGVSAALPPSYPLSNKCGYIAREVERQSIVCLVGARFDVWYTVPVSIVVHTQLYVFDEDGDNTLC